MKKLIVLTLILFCTACGNNKQKLECELEVTEESLTVQNNIIIKSKNKEIYSTIMKITVKIPEEYKPYKDQLFDSLKEDYNYVENQEGIHAYFSTDETSNKVEINIENETADEKIVEKILDIPLEVTSDLATVKKTFTENDYTCK